MGSSTWTAGRVAWMAATTAVLIAVIVVAVTNRDDPTIGPATADATEQPVVAVTDEYPSSTIGQPRAVDLCDTTPPRTADPTCPGYAATTEAPTTTTTLAVTTSGSGGTTGHCVDDDGSTTSLIEGGPCDTAIDTEASIDICDPASVATTDPGCEG